MTGCQAEAWELRQSRCRARSSQAVEDIAVILLRAARGQVLHRMGPARKQLGESGRLWKFLGLLLLLLLSMRLLLPLLASGLLAGCCC